MPSGGARARSGPAPDPNALRRGRKTDAEWTTLPREGRKGRAPKFPLTAETDGEAGLWTALWKKPQAVMWQKLGLQYQVAAYARAFLESTSGDASAGLKTAVLRMEAELGLSLPGMHSLRWKIADDEVAARRDADTVEPRQVAARSRLRALDVG